MPVKMGETTPAAREKAPAPLRVRGEMHTGLGGRPKSRYSGDARGPTGTTEV